VNVRGAGEVAKALGLPIHNYTFGENASLQVSQVQGAPTRGIKTMGIYAPLGAGLTQMIPSTYGPTYGSYSRPTPFHLTGRRCHEFLTQEYTNHIGTQPI
jgi:hypothetical protein